MVVYLSWTLDREGTEDSPRVSEVRYLSKVHVLTYLSYFICKRASGLGKNLLQAASSFQPRAMPLFHHVLVDGL